MCLLVVAWQAHPRYRLVVAANRDEFHARPTAPMAPWPAPNDILAGRDLRAGGTWLGLDRHRRFGVITNFRELQRPRPEAPSRGGLIPQYLGGEASAGAYLAALAESSGTFSGFNLLLADRDSLWYGSNRTPRFAQPLAPGVYGLSNQYLDTPWPKLQRVRRRFDAWLAEPDAGASGLFALLADRTRAAADEDLPSTGIPLEWERVLSAPFVLHSDYGTRASTVLMLESRGAGYLAERRFDAQGALVGESQFELAADAWPSGASHE